LTKEGDEIRFVIIRMHMAGLSPERFAPLGEGILEDAGEDVVRHSLRHAACTGTDLWDSCWIGPPRAKLPPSRFPRWGGSDFRTAL